MLALGAAAGTRSLRLGLLLCLPPPPPSHVLVSSPVTPPAAAAQDPDFLIRKLRDLLGEMTFLEAYERTGRILNITVNSAAAWRRRLLLPQLPAAAEQDEVPVLPPACPH